VLTTLFPSLSVRVHDDSGGFQKLAATMLQVLLLVSVSVVPAVIFLRRPLLDAMLLRGRVTAGDLAMISMVLQWHFLSVVGIVFLNALNRINYALGWIRLAVVGSLLQVGVYFVAAVLLAARYSIVGLAMANAAAWFVASAVLVTVLVVRGQLGDLGRLRRSVGAVGLAGGCLVLALFVTAQAFVTRTWWLIIPAIAGGIGYLFFAVRSLERLGVTLRSLRNLR
jgi:peptidoglycan biosynthesis protein MviN/MurJ (putative lipid II flippase)